MASTATGRAVDEVHSWARRSGDRVHVTLRLPDLALEPDATPTLVLTQRGATATADAAVPDTANGVTVTAGPRAGDLGTGLWRLALRLPGEDGPRRIDARLLLPPRGPVALLTGPAPGRPLRPAVHGGTFAGRALRTIGRVSDAALRQLPPERAVRYRRAVRRAARTVRG